MTSQVFSLKMVFNASGAIFLPVKEQHRDHKAPGISYEDDYKGDAMAAMLKPGAIEIRFHKRYTDQAVARILKSLLATPELAPMVGWAITYQGRPLTP
ncbi:MAG: hypothetical protein GC200_12485 [Tepidisphaera sp.]|nr:hypothetical protein [Tepidisphaera sp.]